MHLRQLQHRLVDSIVDPRLERAANQLGRHAAVQHARLQGSEADTRPVAMLASAMRSKVVTSMEAELPKISTTGLTPS